MKTEAKRKTDALAKARREAKSSLVTNAERWAAFDPRVASALALLRTLPRFDAGAAAGAAATPAATPADAPAVLLKTKELTPPTRARGVGLTRKTPPGLLLDGLTQGPLVEEWKTLSGLSQELFGRGAVVNESTLKIYAAWRDKHTLVEAKRMLYMRRNEPIKDRSTRLEKVWSDALVELFRPRRHDDTRDPWFDYLSSRFQLPFNRKCMEVLSGRNERELFPELRDSGASHANGPRQDRGDDDGFGPRDVLRLVGDSQP